jgi:hypothetical protein
MRNDVLDLQLDNALARYVERESAWQKHDRRGRWVVLEVGIGRYLKDTSATMRQYVDAITPRRGRRFSSLSRARAFANRVGGIVRHWRRQPPSTGVPGVRSNWKRLTAWEWANRLAPTNWSLSMDVVKAVEQETP